MIVIRAAAIVTGLTAMVLLVNVPIGVASVVLAGIFLVMFLIVAHTFGAFDGREEIAEPSELAEHQLPDRRTR